MFNLLKKRASFLREDKKAPKVESPKKPSMAVMIGVGKPAADPIGPGAETDALAGDEDALNVDPQEAAVLAEHHQALADKYRALAGTDESGAEPEPLAEAAAETPAAELAEDDLGEFGGDAEQGASPENGGDLRNSKNADFEEPLSKFSKFKKKGRSF